MSEGHDLYCPCCGGSSHPASGCAYSETYVICGRCIRETWRWVKGHTNVVKRVGKKGESKEFVSFYEAAGKKFEKKEEEK